jgi:hypothetical protein
MASECLLLLLETVADPQKACESRELPVSYIERESCGGIRTDAPSRRGRPAAIPFPEKSKTAAAEPQNFSAEKSRTSC